MRRTREARSGPVDVVLGVAVTGRVARLALVGGPADGGQIYDEYALDLPADAMTRNRVKNLFIEYSSD